MKLDKSDYMTMEEAIFYMKQSEDVHDWNDRRDTVKELVHPDERRKILAEIDCKGLIVKTLKKRK